jgi:tetratricopeptide (TPR) repeat protein
MKITHFCFGRYTLLFLFSGLVLLASACAQERPETHPVSTITPITVDPAIETGLKNAVGLFNASNFDGALESLKKLYKEHPNLAPPRIVLAQWFAQANLGEAVRASLEQATVETPNDPDAYILLGEILLRQNYLTAAELLFNTATTKLESYSVNNDRKKNMQNSLYRNQIALAEQRNRWEELVKLVEKAIAFSGETAMLDRQKAVALFQLKKDAEAFALLQKADGLKQEGKPDDGLPAEAALSQLYTLREDKENAKKYLAQALQKYPKSKEIIVLSIQARLNEDKLEEANQLAEQLLKDNPDWLPAKKLRATIALYLDDFLVAEKLFQELILAVPSDEQAKNGLALAQCEQNDKEKLARALQYAQENVQSNKQNADYWATLGWVLYKADQLQQSAQALKQAAGTGQVNAATAYYLARLAMKTGKSEESRKLLEAAIGSPSPFAKRRDAVKLLEELKK